MWVRDRVSFQALDDEVRRFWVTRFAMNRGNVIHRLRFRIGDPIAESVDCNSAIFKTGKPRSIDRGSRGREDFAKSIVRIYIYI